MNPVSTDSSKKYEAFLPTEWGSFRMMAFGSDLEDYTPTLVLAHPDMDSASEVPVRIHSECITGDLFHSQRCDCGKQLDAAMRYISEHQGVLIYLRQEGRGIGIINKLRAYNKQDEGMDTIEANVALGFDVDGREYTAAVDVLKDLNIKRLVLLTNNPDKIQALESDEYFETVRRLPLEVKPSEANAGYLRTKKDDMGHLLSF